MNPIVALWRWLTFYNWRKGLAINRAAESQFTGSATGISDAFDLHQQRLIEEYRAFFDSLAQVETAVEGKRQQLEKVRAKIKETQEVLEGALATVEKGEGDTSAAEADAVEFQGQIDDLTAKEKGLEADVEAQEARLKELEGRLGKMQQEIRDLPEEKANAIADFVSNAQLIEANERLTGLSSRIDRGPIDAVRAANDELAAKARVSSRMTGAATTDKREQYKEAGAKSAAKDKVAAMLAARKAEKEAKTGGGAGEKKAEERPTL